MKSEILNTWEHSKKFSSKKLFIPNETSMKLHSDVNAKGTLVSEEFRHLYDEDKYARAFHSSPLAAFMHYLELGIAPPIETLFAISNCFGRYFHADGKLELEDVFFGHRRKRVGNMSAVRASQEQDDVFVMIHLTMIEKFKTQFEDWASDVEIVASIILKYDHSKDKDPESVLRAYKRKLKDPKSVLAKFIKVEDLTQDN